MLSGSWSELKGFVAKRPHLLHVGNLVDRFGFAAGGVTEAGAPAPNVPLVHGVVVLAADG